MVRAHGVPVDIAVALHLEGSAVGGVAHETEDAALVDDLGRLLKVLVEEEVQTAGARGGGWGENGSRGVYRSVLVRVEGRRAPGQLLVRHCDQKGRGRGERDGRRLRQLKEFSSKACLTTMCFLNLGENLVGDTASRK